MRMYTEVYVDKKFVEEAAKELKLLYERINRQHPNWGFDVSAEPCNWERVSEEDDASESEDDDA